MSGVVALVAIIVAASGLVVGSAPASGAPPTGAVALATGHMDWGFRANFRDYVLGSSAPEPISVADGATLNGDGTFRFPVTGGYHDPPTGTTQVHLGGSITFDYPEHFFRITVAHPTVVLGFSRQVLRADVTTSITNPAYGSSSQVDQGEVGDLDISGVTPVVGGATTTWPAVPGVLSEAGVSSFAGFLWAGAELDPLTLTYQGPGGPPTADLPAEEEEEPDDTWVAPGTVRLDAPEVVPDAGGGTGLLWHRSSDRLLLRVGDAVRAYDVATGAPAGAVEGLAPLTMGGFFLGADGTAYSVDGSGSEPKTVTAIDPTTMTVIGTVTVDPETLPEEGYFTNVHPDGARSAFFAYVEDHVVEVDAATGDVLRTSAALPGSSNSVLADPVTGDVYAWRFSFAGGSLGTTVQVFTREGPDLVPGALTELPGQFQPRLLDHRTGRIYALANLGGIKTVVFEARDAASGTAVEQLGAPFEPGGLAAPTAYDPASQDFWYADLANGTTSLIDMASRTRKATFDAVRLAPAYAVTDGSRTFAPGPAGIHELVRSVSPSIVTDPADQAVVVGHGQAATSVTLTAVAAATPAPTVQWQVSTPPGPWGAGPWTDVAGATEPTFTFDARLADDGVRFRAVFTNAVGSHGTQPATVAVTAGPRPPADERWIDQVGTDLLGRPFEPAGRTYWTGLLAAGQSRTAIAERVGGSVEARRLSVDRLYRRYLGRSGDGAGVAHWADQIGAGRSPDWVRRHLLASGEYLSRAGGTPAAFVDALYADALRRPVDGPGRAYWVGQLARSSRAALVTRFLDTPEARGAVVDDLYRRFLDRGASRSERAAGVTAMAGGTSEIRLSARILAGYEYADRT